jgi:hypothetical protein
MTMKYKESLTLTRERVAEVFRGLDFPPEATANFWRRAQKLAMPKKLSSAMAAKLAETTALHAAGKKALAKKAARKAA